MQKLPELDQITGFLTVAEELSFRRAAERLSIDQSVLSRRVKALEDRLGFPLLFRTTHDVRLTDAGRAFYQANRGIVEHLHDAVDHARRVARGTTGRLRIAYITFAALELLPAAIRAYQLAFPDVALRLSYQPTMSQKLSLARGEIDIGLMLGPFEHTDFDTMRVAEERMVAVMGDGHRLAARQELRLADIADEPLVLGTHDQWDFYRNTIAEMFALKGCRLRIAHEAPSLIGILGLVRGGLGVTLLPEVMQRFCPRGLTARPILDAEAPVVTVAAWRRSPEGNAGGFVSVLRNTVAAGRRFTVKP